MEDFIRVNVQLSGRGMKRGISKVGLIKSGPCQLSSSNDATGVSASVRFLFAFFVVDECYRDVSTTSFICIEPEQGSKSQILRLRSLPFPIHSANRAMLTGGNHMANRTLDQA